MRRLRTVLFWCHLSVALCVVTVVVIMSATGVLLTYQKQMTAWADRRAVNAGPPTPGAQRLGAGELLRRAREAAGAEPTAITLRSHPDAPAEVSFGRERRELVNSYNGALLGAGSTGMRDFFRVVTAWHRTVGATKEKRELGKALSGASNLAFLFLVISGFFLWWPRNWTPSAFRAVLFFRRSLSSKARDFNWHHVIGIWSLVPLFLIVLSGSVISYRWMSNLVYTVVGEEPPPAAPPAGGQGAAGRAPEGRRDAAGRPDGDRDAAPAAETFDSYTARFAQAAEKAPGWTSIAMTLPSGRSRDVSFALDQGMGGQPQLRSTLVLDRASGQEVRFEPFAAQSTGRRLRSILRFAHTGEVLGVVGQTLAGLVSLGTVLLAYTGLALSFRRLRAWLARRAWERKGLAEPATQGAEAAD